MATMSDLIQKLRVRLDDLEPTNEQFEDTYLTSHIQNNLDSYDYDIAELSKKEEQLIVLETLIDITITLKMWADGESYSYKNDAIQLSRGLLAKHYADTIKILKQERNEILEGNGGFY